MKTHPSASILRLRGRTCAVLLVFAFLTAGGLAAQDVKLPLKTIQVKPFTQAEGLGLSEEFINYFNEGLVKFMPKTKVAAQVWKKGPKCPRTTPPTPSSSKARSWNSRRP